MIKTKINRRFAAADIRALLKSKYPYIGLIVLFLGIQLNITGQIYLFNSFDEGNSLPQLSDLILDNIPLWNIDFLCDIFSISSFLIFIVYVIHKRQINRIPYFFIVWNFYLSKKFKIK